MSITDWEVFASLKKANIKLDSTKCIVSRTLPPFVPITESIWTTAVSGFWNLLMGCYMCILCIIKGLHQCTLTNRLTTITYIRRSKSGRAYFKHKVMTMLITFSADFTILCWLASTVITTDVFLTTSHSIFACIKRVTRISHRYFRGILFDFSWNSSWIFIQQSCNCFDRHTFFQRLL